MFMHKYFPLFHTQNRETVVDCVERREKGGEVEKPGEFINVPPVINIFREIAIKS
jgi:hypothetical protein